MILNAFSTTYTYSIYSISTVIFLENLTKICSELSSIGINLWMMGENTKDGRKVNVLCIVDWNHQRSMVVVDYSRNFKGI